MNVRKQLEQFEKRLLEHDVRLNEDELSTLLADDFVEFGASGIAWTKAEVITGLQNEAFVPRLISNFVVKPLSGEVMLVTYLCRSAPTDQDREVNSLRSSIWRMYGNEWQMVFHQGTRCP
jgi:hypothetical protein